MNIQPLKKPDFSWGLVVAMALLFWAVGFILPRLA